MEKREHFRETDFEVMAPAGSYESLQAAIGAGADSVYFGAGELNMRAHSSANFNRQDIARIAETCRSAGVKSYLTLNTILFDNDLAPMRAMVDCAKAAGIDAIIASDPAVLLYAAQQGVAVHLSTQLNITNAEALAFYARYADVAVLAREVDLDRVALIHKQIEEQPILGPQGKPVRIEMFAHGALCMAVSGKCYLSLHELNRSANRGECGQICRRSYRVWDETSDIELKVENRNIMSPKDLKTVHFINKLMDAGVRVFKIEGRARGPEYVHTVVSVYKEAIRAVCDGSYTQERIKEWDERLATVFNRGFWNGYYLGQRLGEWTPIYGSAATREKIYVGKITNYFSKLGVAEVLLEAGSLAKGDRILITGPTTGLVETDLTEIRLDLAPVEEAPKGSIVSVPVPERVRPNDRLYTFNSRTQTQQSYLQ